MTQRELAIEIVGRLQSAGHVALLAGGCVRDQLMGDEPKDYDVATSATPETVEELFGRRRTLPIGKSFGVITVLGPREAGQVEVATFRTDGGYSDGRRPDTVSFSDARNDALRRDFTINGMFLDPVTNMIHDYVGGKADLEERIVRAIGDPEQRIYEDKLRMIRAVRFAARYGFAIDPATMEAIRKHAAGIRVVSGERIGAEMRRMLIHPTRTAAVELLVSTGLLNEIVDGAGQLVSNRANWRTRLKWLDGLGQCRFSTAVAVLLGPIIKESGIGPVAERWKLSNEERSSIGWIEANWVTLLRGSSIPWSGMQPLLIHPDAGEALKIAESSTSADQAGVRFCRERMAWEAERLNPPPLLDGSDLKRLGMRPGPRFGEILSAIRSAQLDGEIRTREEAEKKAIAYGGAVSDCETNSSRPN